MRKRTRTVSDGHPLLHYYGRAFAVLYCSLSSPVLAVFTEALTILCTRNAAPTRRVVTEKAVCPDKCSRGVVIALPPLTRADILNFVILSVYWSTFWTRGRLHSHHRD